MVIDSDLASGMKGFPFLDRFTSLARNAIAFCWAHLVGERLHSSGAKRLRRKTHGRRAKSFFRHGLDHLRCVLNHVHHKYDEFRSCLKVWSCSVYPELTSAPLTGCAT